VAQASRLLLGLPVRWQVAAGTRLAILGWSGTDIRKTSNAFLKSPLSFWAGN